MMGITARRISGDIPAEFRRFLPDCETAELRNCTREQVVNAYDNAILYTDHVLASVIGTLSASRAGSTAR